MFLWRWMPFIHAVVGKRLSWFCPTLFYTHCLCAQLFFWQAQKRPFDFLFWFLVWDGNAPFTFCFDFRCADKPRDGPLTFCFDFRCESVTQYAFPFYSNTEDLQETSSESQRPHQRQKVSPKSFETPPEPTQGDSTPSKSPQSPRSPKPDVDRYDDTPFMGEAIAVLKSAESELLARANEVRTRRKMLEEALKDQQKYVEIRNKRLREERRQRELLKKLELEKRAKSKGSLGEKKASDRKKQTSSKFSFSSLFRLS